MVNAISQDLYIKIMQKLDEGPHAKYMHKVKCYCGKMNQGFHAYNKTNKQKELRSKSLFSPVWGFFSLGILCDCIWSYAVRGFVTTKNQHLFQRRDKHGTNGYHVELCVERKVMRAKWKAVGEGNESGTKQSDPHWKDWSEKYPWEKSDVKFIKMQCIKHLCRLDITAQSQVPKAIKIQADTNSTFFDYIASGTSVYRSNNPFYNTVYI